MPFEHLGQGVYQLAVLRDLERILKPGSLHPNPLVLEVLLLLGSPIDASPFEVCIELVLKFLSLIVLDTCNSWKQNEELE